MGRLVDNHPGLIDAEFALNEGGRTRIIEGGRTYLAVQSAEKISHVVTVTAYGSAGYACSTQSCVTAFRRRWCRAESSSTSFPIRRGQSSTCGRFPAYPLTT